MTIEPAHRADWPQSLRRYLCVSIVANLVWEILQLPLYTLWATGTRREQAFAVLHCTIGDAIDWADHPPSPPARFASLIPGAPDRSAYLAVAIASRLGGVPVASSSVPTGKAAGSKAATLSPVRPDVMSSLS